MRPIWKASPELTYQPFQKSVFTGIASVRTRWRPKTATRAAERAGDALHHALEHERDADEPVRRADELHHLDLASSGKGGQPDRVHDQEERREQQREEDQRGSRVGSSVLAVSSSFTAFSAVLISSTPGWFRYCVGDLLGELGLARARPGTTRGGPPG